MVLEKNLESPLDCKEIQPVHPKGDQSWVFIGRADGKAETPILWPPHAKSWLIGKDSDDGEDWRQEEKGTTEDGMVGRHHRHDGHEFEQAPGFCNGQGTLACCSPWVTVGHDERLNWTDRMPFKKLTIFLINWGNWITMTEFPLPTLQRNLEHKLESTHSSLKDSK